VQRRLVRDNCKRNRRLSSKSDAMDCTCSEGKSEGTKVFDVVTVGIFWILLVSVRQLSEESGTF
jgi:hypothetical protein